MRQMGKFKLDVLLQEYTKQDMRNKIGSLCNVFKKVHKHDLLTVMGDLNANVWEGNVGYESIMGEHGIGVRNKNGEGLVDLCGLNNLVITGTIFPHQQIHKRANIGFSRRVNKEPNW